MGKLLSAAQRQRDLGPTDIHDLVATNERPPSPPFSPAIVSELALAPAPPSEPVLSSKDLPEPAPTAALDSSLGQGKAAPEPAKDRDLPDLSLGLEL